MSLNLPSGTTCFIDANIFVYHFVELGEISSVCRAFLGRVAQGEVDAVTSAPCLADAVHRVMGIEAQERFGLTGGAIAWLQRHPHRVGELTAFVDAARQIERLSLPLLPADNQVIREAAELSAREGLLTNDALIVATMRRNGITHLATNDDDFDRVHGLTVWKPR